MENKGKLIQTVFSPTCIEGITLGAGEEVGKVAGGVSGRDVYRIGEVGNRTVNDRLLECMGQVLQQVSGKGRRQR